VRHPRLFGRTDRSAELDTAHARGEFRARYDEQAVQARVGLNERFHVVVVGETAFDRCRHAA
jgi:hypothetical protein